jgi:hypothetical protein
MRCWLTCVLLCFATAANASQCRYIAGVEPLLVPGRVVLVGEMHGTKEMPEVLVALVGRAVERGLPVDVGLEADPPAQVAIERYMKTGELKDRYAIVAPRVAYGDGTASEALLEMYTALRAMHGVRFFTFAAGRTNQRYADNISAARRPEAVTFAYMGNAHAETKREGDDDEDPAGMVLRKAGLDVVSLYIDFTGGSAYYLGTSGPCVHARDDASTQTPPGTRPYVLVRAKGPAYDLALSVGEIHPSLPASPP